MISRDAEVPFELHGSGFVATPLTLAHVELDHAAYVASPEVIRAHSAGRWPIDGFTVAANRPLVERHQADHRARRAFTFILLDAGGTSSVGCLYLNPLLAYLERAGAAAKLIRRTPPSTPIVSFWIRQDLEDTDLVPDVAGSVHRWLTEVWPVRSHLFRILPEEEAARRTLTDLGLRRVMLALPDEDLPYLWFA